MLAALALLIMLSAASSADLYSALVGLDQLVLTQKAILQHLDGSIEAAERRVEELQKARDAYHKLEVSWEPNFEEFVSHPVNAFVLFKRLTVDWTAAKSIAGDLPPSLKEGQAVVFPDDEDLSGAVKALLRVQATYDLDAGHLADGLIPGVPRATRLSADDCFEIGRQAFDIGQSSDALSWLTVAKAKQAQDREAVRNSTELNMYLSMSEAYEKERSSLMHFTNSLLQLGFMMTPSFENPGLDDTWSRAQSNNAFMSQTNVYDEAVYRELCSSSRMSRSPDRGGRCRLFAPHPYLLLQPARQEVLQEDPPLSLFHGVVSDAEVDLMKAAARPQLQRAEVAEYTSSLGHRVSDTRVTKIAWLRLEENPVVRRVYGRIERITGLSSATAEPLQAACYGLGGHFHLHMDVLPDTEKYFGAEMGNRIATWLIYLSDVTGGGATVFPRLNITVWPTKGSALYWHNVKSNGVGNILTLHGACPVVSGTKWVSNVWFHERGQEFRMQCGLDPESSLQRTDSFQRPGTREERTTRTRNK